MLTKNMLIMMFCLLPGFFAHAQMDGNRYRSEADELVTIRKVGILPVTDNADGIYARYVEDELKNLIGKSHRFDLFQVTGANPKMTTMDYERNPSMIRSLGGSNPPDGYIGARVTKNSKGVSITLDLFVRRDGKLFLQEILREDPRYSSAEVKRHTRSLFSNIVKKIPYSGLVLSRQGNRITVDIGKSTGVTKGTIISLEQVISVTRHPKFNFLLTSEKEILGKARLVKVDKTLSFAVILQEKDRGVIQPNAKVTGLNFVKYQDPMAVGAKKQKGTPFSKDPVSFGKNPKEWLPEKKPTFGRVGLSLGLGTLRYAQSLTSGGSFASSTGIYPQLDLNSEIWITPSWFAGATLRQGVFSLDNKLPAGSTPASLNATSTFYDFHLGYNLLLKEDFHGPKARIYMGVNSNNVFVDASTPLSFTTTTYGGLYLGLGASTPFGKDRKIYADIHLTRHIFARLEESPSSSGASSDNSITVFGFGGDYFLTNRFAIRGELDFEFYATTFSGTGSRGDAGLNMSQNFFTFRGGITYLF